MLQADDRVHFTHLKAMSDSPLHYLASVEEGFESSSFAFGRLVHYLTLGGLEGKDYFVYRGKGNRNSNEYKAFADLHEGGDIYKVDEVIEASRLAAAVKMDPVVQRLGLLEGEKELLLDWDNLGVPFRSHLDVLGVASSGPRKGRRHVVDVKTTQSANPKRFHWEARRYAYHAQLATYEDAARFIQQPADDAFIIAVEKSLPYAVAVFQILPSLLEEGRRLTRTWLELYRLCKATGEWPGYVQDVVAMDVLSADDESPLVLTMHDGTEVAA